MRRRNRDRFVSYLSSTLFKHSQPCHLRNVSWHFLLFDIILVIRSPGRHRRRSRSRDRERQPRHDDRYRDYGREPRDREKDKHRYVLFYAILFLIQFLHKVYVVLSHLLSLCNRSISMQSGREWKDSYRRERGDDQHEYRREDERDRHRREKGMVSVLGLFMQ